MLIVAVVALLLASCGGDYAPKPAAYLRIDLPAKDYALLDTAALPFVFEKAADCQVVVKQTSRLESWIDLQYPSLDGVVFLTYRRMANPSELPGQVDTAYRLLEQHFNFSSGVEEQAYENPTSHLYATTYHIKGNRVASTYQFWATDSVRHFLRGAMYINKSPNNDSLAPVLDYLQADVDHLIETLSWR